MQEIQVQSLGWEDPLEKEMATHSTIFAWKIPRTEEPGGLQSIGLKNPMDRGAWRATVHGVTKESDSTYQLNYRLLRGKTAQHL